MDVVTYVLISRVEQCIGNNGGVDDVGQADPDNV